MRRVARGIGTVGKELTRGGASAREQMGKKYGKYYDEGFRGKSWMSGKKGAERAGAAKYLDPFQRKLAELKVARKSRRGYSQPGRLGLRGEDVRQKAYPIWLKTLGKQKADLLLASQGVDSPHSGYAGVGEVLLKKGEENIWGTQGLSRQDKQLAVEGLRGAAPLSAEEMRPERREFTQEKNAEVAEEFGKELGPQAQAAYERSWGVEKLGTANPAKGNEAEAPAPRSWWNISSANRWGRRQGNDQNSNNK